jgi:spore germination protein YaaH
METRTNRLNSIDFTFLARLAENLSRALLLSSLALASLTAAEKPATSSKPVFKPDATLLRARWRVLNTRPLGMYYCYSDSHAEEALNRHARQMTLIAPQSFWVDAEGFVHGEISARILNVARRAALPVMPLVVNPGFDRNTATALLHSDAAQERAVTYLAYLAKRENFVGWQLDLEYLDPADKDFYTRFVQRAAAKLHQGGRLLSVAVVPRFSDIYPDHDPSQEFHSTEWGAPYDFAALGRSADFITLMTYDHHNRNSAPGPVAGYDWVKAAVDYATSRVPRQKVLLGIPFYGREWTETRGETSTRTLTFAEARRQMEQLNVKPLWNEHWLTPWFQYSDDAGLHTGWYEDSRSLGGKLDLMRRYRLRGFAAWRVGDEDPRFWTLVSAKRQVTPKNQKLIPAQPANRAPRRASDPPVASRHRKAQ